jgi:hypothetical protein
MSDRDCVKAQHLEASLQPIADTIRQVAHDRQGDNLALLSLLRLLESLHQEIRDSLFQDSLPDNRQALYSLLKDIEASGGWPYIHRMKLRSLLSKFQDTSAKDPASSFASFIPLSSDDEPLL